LFSPDALAKMFVMSSTPNVNLWSSAKHALDYLGRADRIPHRVEGEATLLEFLPAHPARILDLGSGGGRLLGLVKAARPEAEFVAVDFSPTMLETLRKSFEQNQKVSVVEHDLSEPLPDLGSFGAIVSSFAIHHLLHERKRALYKEIFDALLPGGVFCNLEHVASPTQQLHNQFLEKLDIQPGKEDPSNKLLALQTQLEWLKEAGFEDMDCHWKWRELALFVGVRPWKAVV
jgi:tRNA (cmo5U34)-methyltransferase